MGGLNCSYESLLLKNRDVFLCVKVLVIAAHGEKARAFSSSPRWLRVSQHLANAPSKYLHSKLLISLSGILLGYTGV